VRGQPLGGWGLPARVPPQLSRPFRRGFPRAIVRLQKRAAENCHPTQLKTVIPTQLKDCHSDRSFPFPKGKGKRSGGTCCLFGSTRRNLPSVWKHRGRAALQRRAKRSEEVRASAPVVAFRAHNEFLRNPLGAVLVEAFARKALSRAGPPTLTPPQQRVPHVSRSLRDVGYHDSIPLGSWAT
jgi:hypothetical protein